eukprot:2487300-Pyramimonas_sp.AAC.1
MGESRLRRRPSAWGRLRRLQPPMARPWFASRYGRRDRRGRRPQRRPTPTSSSPWRPTAASRS